MTGRGLFRPWSLAFLAGTLAVLAQAGIWAKAPDSTAAVSYIPAASVSAAFDKGGVLLGQENYMVHASRREGPGLAEIHTKDTDIIYVLEGSATLVTGGEAVDPRPTAADEIRGAAIRGGEPHLLTKGDVLVVPHGVPHWFKEVEGPFLYYVVKVR